ncbi:MAG: DUF6134 family protein [Pseudomonadota bacterium]
MNRRSVLAGAVASVSLAPFSATHAETTAKRLFRILRDGDDIGRHSLTLTPRVDGLEVLIDIDIAVKVLGFTAYRYTLRNREIWQKGALVSLDSQTDDDGENERVSIRQVGGQLEVDGSGYTGIAPLSAVTTSYYAQDFIERRPWISTQSGQLLKVSTAVKNGGSLKRVAVTGDLEKTIVYDSRGEWVSSEFDAGGELARYEVIEQSGQVAALWQSA